MACDRLPCSGTVVGYGRTEEKVYTDRYYTVPSRPTLILSDVTANGNTLKGRYEVTRGESFKNVNVRIGCKVWFVARISKDKRFVQPRNATNTPPPPPPKPQDPNNMNLMEIDDL